MYKKVNHRVILQQAIVVVLYVHCHIQHLTLSEDVKECAPLFSMYMFDIITLTICYIHSLTQCAQGRKELG